MKQREFLQERGQIPTIRGLNLNTSSNIVKTKQGLQNARMRKRLTFYCCILALPVLQFIIFYIYVNFNSFVMAFTKYENNPNGAGYLTSFAGFDHFKTAWGRIAESSYMIKNSLLLFVCQIAIGFTLALVFSFYIYKKFFAHGVFKTILFLPQIVSGVVFGLIFMYLADDAYPVIMSKYFGKDVEYGLLSSIEVSVRRSTVLSYCVCMGFGIHVLMFSGSMSGINESIVESAKIDGASLVQEFIHITVPMIWPTLSQFIVIGVAAIFTDQMHLFTFYQESAGELSTIGYFLFVQAKGSDLISDNVTKLSYPELSAYGLIITAILYPLTMMIRKGLTKFGPSVE